MSYSRTLSYAVAFATCLLFTDIAKAQLNVGKSIRGIVGKVIATPGNIMPSAPTRSTCPNMNRPPTTVRPPVATQPPVYVQPPRYVQPPVYTQPQPRVIHTQPRNYTQPVYSQPQPAASQSVYVAPPVTSNPVVAQPTPAKSQPSTAARAKAKQLANEAKKHFRSGLYGKAKANLDEIVKLVPKDGSGWQFRGLVNFAMSDFDAAAADMYDALSYGKAWPRKSVDALYGKHAADYASQLEKLDEFVASDPSMQGHFLLAYHHTVNNQLEEAKADLQNVLKLQPDEPLSKQLLASLEQQLAQN